MEQAFDWFPLMNVLFNNLVNVFDADSTVPNIIGGDPNCRTRATLS